MPALQLRTTHTDRRVPAIAMTGWRTRITMPRPGVLFPVLAVVVGLAGLVYEAVGGWESRVRLRTLLEVPAWVVLGGLVLVGAATFVQRRRNPAPRWYRWWSFVDYVEEPSGLRLFAGRMRADHPGIAVRRGDTVDVRVVLIRKNGAARDYAFQVSTPDGVLAFEAPIYVEKLSMATLDEQAERWGFRVVAHDDAALIRRLREVR